MISFRILIARHFLLVPNLLISMRNNTFTLIVGVIFGTEIKFAIRKRLYLNILDTSVV